jgi:hypothetical protein
LREIITPNSVRPSLHYVHNTHAALQNSIQGRIHDRWSGLQHFEVFLHSIVVQ